MVIPTTLMVATTLTMATILKAAMHTVVTTVHTRKEIFDFFCKIAEDKGHIIKEDLETINTILLLFKI